MSDFFTFIKNSFEGNERLWKVFWVLGFGGKLACLALTFVLFQGIGVWGVAVGFSIVAAFKVYWGYSVWKCSGNVDDKLWKYAALVFTVLSVLFGIAGITSNDYRVLKDPRPLLQNDKGLRDLKVFM